VATVAERTLAGFAHRATEVDATCAVLVRQGRSDEAIARLREVTRRDILPVPLQGVLFFALAEAKTKRLIDGCASLKRAIVPQRRPVLMRSGAFSLEFPERAKLRLKSTGHTRSSDSI
jgi:hypothetical protein